MSPQTTGEPTTATPQRNDRLGIFRRGLGESLPAKLICDEYCGGADNGSRYTTTCSMALGVAVLEKCIVSSRPQAKPMPSLRDCGVSFQPTRFSCGRYPSRTVGLGRILPDGTARQQRNLCSVVFGGHPSCVDPIFNTFMRMGVLVLHIRYDRYQQGPGHTGPQWSLGKPSRIRLQSPVQDTVADLQRSMSSGTLHLQTTSASIGRSVLAPRPASASRPMEQW